MAWSMVIVQHVTEYPSERETIEEENNQIIQDKEEDYAKGASPNVRTETEQKII